MVQGWGIAHAAGPRSRGSALDEDGKVPITAPITAGRGAGA